MDLLPNELQLEWLYRTDLDTLINVCETDRYYRDICGDDRFWMRRILTKYPDIEKSPHLSWRRFSITFERGLIKRIRIFVNNRYIETTDWINTDTLLSEFRDITDRILEYPEDIKRVQFRKGKNVIFELHLNEFVNNNETIGNRLVEIDNINVIQIDFRKCSMCKSERINILGRQLRGYVEILKGCKDCHLREIM